MLTFTLFIILTVVALPSINISSVSATRICAIVLFFTSILSYNINITIAIGSGINLYSNLIQVTSTSHMVDILLGIVGAAALTPWAPLSLVKYSYINTVSVSVFTLIPLNTYYALLALFSVTGSSLLVSSASLICLYLSLEVQSFGVYIIAAIYRNSETATDAGLTYFLLGGLSSCFILLGSAEIYASIGVTNLEQIYVLLSTGESYLSSQVAFSLTVLAAGLSFKIAAAPFHQWAPDVYDRVPTIVTAWLQTIPKIAVLGLFLDITGGLTFISDALIITIPFGDVNTWTDTLIVVAILSLIIGSVLGLSQTRIKRLLTYSTISHVGFILLALSAYSTDAVTSFFFYLAQYSVTSLASLIIILAFGYVIRNIYINTRAHAWDIELLSELTGQIKSQPILSLGFAFLLFSIAGVPPFVGFFAKQGVLEASLTAHYGGLAVLAIIASVISASYYLKVVRLIQFNKNINKSIISLEIKNNTLTSIHTFILSSILILVTFYIILPSSFLDSTRTLALILTSF